MSVQVRKWDEAPVMDDEERFRGIVVLQAWTAYRNGMLPASVTTLAAATADPERAEVAIRALADGAGPLAWDDDRVDVAGEGHTDRLRRVTDFVRSAGVPDEALPVEMLE
jgi:hypothetical protein